MTHPRSHTRPLDAASMALVVFICFTWGFNQPAIKLAIHDVPPLIAMRDPLGLATLMVLGLMRLRGLPVTARDGTLVAGLVAGALFGFEFLLIYRGLLYTTASRAVLFIYLAPFFVVIGARWLFPGDRFGLMQWLGLLMAFVGMVVAFGVPAPASSPHQLLGDLMMAARRAGLGRDHAGHQVERARPRVAGKDAALSARGLRADRGARRAHFRRTDRGDAVGGGARLARLSDHRGRHDLQPVVRADRQILGEPPLGLHISDAAFRGRGGPSGAGRAFDAGFCARRGAGGGRADTRQPAPVGLYVCHGTSDARSWNAGGEAPVGAGQVGNVTVGGGAPVVVQSMTNTDTADIDGTVRQALRHIGFVHSSRLQRPQIENHLVRHAAVRARVEHRVVRVRAAP